MIMSYTGSVHIDGIIPASFKNGTSALTDKYLAVKLNASNDNTVDVAGASDEFTTIGITQNQASTKAGEAVAVKTRGFTLAQAGGTVTIGAKLKLATGGKLVATTTATDEYIAICLSNGASGDIIEVNLLGCAMTI